MVPRRASAPGPLAQTGTTAPVQLTITNRRDTEVTYDLSQTADGVTLTGIPDHVTLAAGCYVRRFDYNLHR